MKSFTIFEKTVVVFVETIRQLFIREILQSNKKLKSNNTCSLTNLKNDCDLADRNVVIFRKNYPKTASKRHLTTLMRSKMGPNLDFSEKF